MDQAAVHFDKNQNLLTVYPVGRLDSETSPKLLRQLEPEMEGIENVIIDFAHVDYISSGGMRMLLTVAQAMEGKGGAVRLIHVNEYIREIFEMIGLAEMIQTK